MMRPRMHVKITAGRELKKKKTCTFLFLFYLIASDNKIAIVHTATCEYMYIYIEYVSNRGIFFFFLMFSLVIIY
jgi:hypothetical protein